MKMNVSISLQRFDERVAAAQAALQNPDKLLGIATTGAEIFEAEAKILCPVLDGDLRDSIHQEVIESSSTRARVGVVPDAPHAARIEFGYKGPDTLGRHFHQGPHSYMRAARDTKEAEAKQAMIEAGQALIDGALK